LLHCGYAAVVKTYVLTVQSRGTVALPADLRRRLRLDQPDAQIKLIEQDDGRVELVPVVAIPADQAWFWTDRWQAMEREADDAVAAGRTVVVDGLEGLLDAFDRSRGTDVNSS
jgi:bifunctional DNA-binding transcriptional regulator/antitoxin component of YhaV-PrlF toxin-antitoxin module